MKCNKKLMPQLNHDLVLVGKTLLGTCSSKTFLTWSPGLHKYQEGFYRNSKSFRFLSCHCHFEESALSLHNFYRIEVWRLARPLHDSWQYVLGLCHVGRWIHSPSSLFFKVLVQDSTVHGPVHWPLYAVKCDCIMFSPPCLIVGMMFLGHTEYFSSFKRCASS